MCVHERVLTDRRRIPFVDKPPFLITEPVYGSSLYLLETDNYEDYKALCELNHLDEPLDDRDFASCWAGSTFSADGKTGVVHFLASRHQDPNCPGDFHLVPHEVFHFVQGLFANIGIHLNDSSEEAYAYLLGYYCDQVFSRL